MTPPHVLHISTHDSGRWFGCYGHETARPMWELYDLHADPHECRNLAGTADLHEVEEELRRHLKEWMRQVGDPCVT